MKILLISDAWHPQINGVVRTLEATSRELALMGHEVKIIGPDPTRPFVIAAPSYPAIKLEFFAHGRIRRILRAFAPDLIHIATEGPLGWAARSVCLHDEKPFTTSFHTSFPDYLAKRSPRFLAPFVAAAAFAVIRRFHAPAGATMVATASVEADLRAHKFRRLVRWSRGVNTDLFKPAGKNFDAYKNLPRPILLNVGRVSVEKNLTAFLDLQTPGSKVILGDGPGLALLRKQYPAAHFLGNMEGARLAHAFAAADLFVFPSKTDTFGLVLLEACASGLRIAAYPVSGPADLFNDEKAKEFACLDEDLQKAVDRALLMPDNPDLPRAFAEAYSWRACAEQFYAHLQAPSPKAKRSLLRWRKSIGEGM